MCQLTSQSTLVSDCKLQNILNWTMCHLKRLAASNMVPAQLYKSVSAAIAHDHVLTYMSDMRETYSFQPSDRPHHCSKIYHQSAVLLSFKMVVCKESSPQMKIEDCLMVQSISTWVSSLWSHPLM